MLSGGEDRKATLTIVRIMSRSPAIPPPPRSGFAGRVRSLTIATTGGSRVPAPPCVVCVAFNTSLPS